MGILKHLTSPDSGAEDKVYGVNWNELDDILSGVDVDERASAIFSGLDAAKPTAGQKDRLYYATDTKILYYDTGSAWVEICRGETATRLVQLSEKDHASLTGVTTDQHHNKNHGVESHFEGSARISRDLDANKPAPGYVNRLFFASDTKILYRDTGSTWEEILRGETVSRLAQLAEKSHANLTNVTADQHHAQLHKASHEGGGGDALTALNAGIITSGILTATRGGLGKILDEAAIGDDKIIVYKTTGDKFVYETKPSGADHNILSATHLDTLTASVAVGDIIIGNATPKWSRLARGTDGQFLKLISGLPAWADPPAGADHNLLSTTHPDTLAGSVVRGDLIVGNSTPKWARLAIGSTNRVLKSDGVDPSWGQVGHGELTGVTSDQHHAQLHKDAHKSGGGDAFALADLLDCLARIDVKKAGVSIGKRRGLNLIEGTNITLTMADDPTNEEVDVTIASAGGGEGEFSWKHYRKSGKYHSIIPVAPTPSTLTIAIDTLFAYPFYVPVSQTFDRIAIHVTTAQAGLARLGIYSDNGTIYPGSLVLDAGTVDISTTGLKEIVISQTLSAGLYWLVFVVNVSNAVFGGYAPAYGYAPIGSDGPYTQPGNRFTVSYTFGTLPSTFPSGASPSAAYMTIALRKS